MIDIILFLVALTLPFILTAFVAADMLIPALEKCSGRKLARGIAFALPILFLLSYHGVLFEAMWQLRQGLTLPHATQAAAATSGLFGVILYLKKVRSRFKQ